VLPTLVAMAGRQLGLAMVGAARMLTTPLTALVALVLAVLLLWSFKHEKCIDFP
jgi:hypothetical protein